MNYDIIIIGGGPAGLTAAKTLYETSPESSTLLLEKSSHYSEVVKCGEGVWKVPFEKLITPQPHWIRLKIPKASFMAPNGVEVLFSDNDNVLGYILDRVQFQEDFLEEISNNIPVKRECRVSSVVPEDGYQRVTLSSGESFTASVVIDASGPASRFGKEYGIEKHTEDLEPAYYAIVENVSAKTDRVVLQMSSHYSPGGYVWHFPVSESVVNVGIVFGKNQSGNIRESLENYIEEYFPDGTVTSWHGGAIPSVSKVGKISAPGYIQCGDSAALVNPATRSGISESMYSGKLAAESALEMLQCGKWEMTAEKYRKRILSDYASKMEKVAKVKKALYEITDEEYNRAAEKLVTIPKEKRSMLKILQTTITKSPKLLLAMRHLL